jgi:transcriptional regulator with XRE-family HTH domain
MCDLTELMSPHDFTAMVRQRIRALVESKRFRQAALADSLGMTQGNISKLLSNNDRPITIEVLAAVSELANIPMAELVAPPGSGIYELSGEHAIVIRALRQWPASVSRALCLFLAYFADEEPAAGQSRRMHELWRQMPASDRAAVFGFALSRSQGALPPDLEAEFFDRLSAESRASVGKPQPKRTRRAKRNDDGTT